VGGGSLIVGRFADIRGVEPRAGISCYSQGGSNYLEGIEVYKVLAGKGKRIVLKGKFAGALTPSLCVVR